MPTDEDFDELKAVVAALKQELTTTKLRLGEMEDFAQTHIGLDWGQAGISANVSHPNISADTVESGAGRIRQDVNGMQLKTDSATPFSALYWPGDLSFDPDSEYPRGEINGYSNNTSSAIVQMLAYKTAATYAGVYVFTGIATNPQTQVASVSPSYSAGISTVSNEASAGAALKLFGSLWTDITPLTQISANTNNYAVGAAYQTAISISSDAARDITGILATGVNDGALLFVQNAGGFAITLKDASGSSDVANQFAFSGDIVLAADDGCILQYDGTATRWRCLGKSSGSTLTTLLLTDTAWAAKGDLAVGTADNTAAILTKGDDGKVLTANSATATGLEWQTPAGGSFSYGKAITTSQGQSFP